MNPVGRRGIGRSVRRFGLAALAIGAAMAVSGCITIQATPEVIYITPPPAATVPASAAPSVAPSDAPSSDASGAVASGTPTVSGEAVNKSAPDGRWTLTFRKPVVAGGSSDTMTTINASIGTRVDGYISAFELSSLPVVATGDAPSSLSGDFSVAYASPSLLSLRFTVATYISGTASTSAIAGSLNFNVTTGSAIQFVDLFTSSGDALAVLKTQAHTLLSAKLGKDLVWPATVTMADFQNAWVFTADGLELTWSQGAVASQAAGTPSIVIPWSALKTVIAPTGPAGSFAI